MLQKMFWLGFAGGLGTLARYGVAGMVQRTVGTDFPWGTLTVNIAGCFVAGVLWAAMERKLMLDPAVKMVVFIGFMGAFTTFSSFMIETGELLRDSSWASALGNVILQNTVGLGALLSGLALGRLVN